MAKTAPQTADLFGDPALDPVPAAPAAARTDPRPSTTSAPAPASGYSAKDIEVLEGLEPVRRRPGMYIGGTDERALHHLFAEILDNAMDEAVAGHARSIEVKLDADGYLSTKFGHAGQGERYRDLEWGHELYCQGHLIQAAVARIRTGHPDDLLVRVARRSADHICRTFGPDGIQSICGHAEIEVALAELGRATG